MKPIIDILPADLEKVCSILDAHTPDFEVWAFGSRVNWKARANSDLDIAVINDIPLTISEMENLKEAFSSSDLPFKVDVVDWASTSEEFKNIIKIRHIIIQDKRVSRIPVSSVARAIIGGTPSRNKPENWNGRIPWATAKDIVSANRYLYKTREHITDHGLANSSAKIMPAGTIVITARGTVGALCQLGQEMSFNQTCYAIVPKDGMDSNYLYYALKGSVKQMKSLTYGTIFDTITKKTFNDWEIPNFPLDKQLAISNILGSLDDKIELNGRMNETLEEIARTLFKSWFVDFDPVRAKMDGHWQPGQSLPGLPAELYNLFPDRLVPSKIGEIPKGWKVKKLGNLVETIRGRSYRSKELSDSDTALVTLKSFNRGGGYRLDGLKPYIGKYKEQQIVRPGELIVAMTDVTQAAEVIGRPAIVQESKYSTLVVSLDCTIVRPRDDTYLSVPYLYSMAMTRSFNEHTYALTTGTTVLHLSREAVPSFLLPLPPKSIVEFFNKLSIPIFKRLANNISESETLATIRDSLIPKLLSGEIRVDNLKNIPE